MNRARWLAAEKLEDILADRAHAGVLVHRGVQVRGGDHDYRLPGLHQERVDHGNGRRPDGDGYKVVQVTVGRRGAQLGGTGCSTVVTQYAPPGFPPTSRRRADRAGGSRSSRSGERLYGGHRGDLGGVVAGVVLTAADQYVGAASRAELRGGGVGRDDADDDELRDIPLHGLDTPCAHVHVDDVGGVERRVGRIRALCSSWTASVFSDPSGSAVLLRNVSSFTLRGYDEKNTVDGDAHVIGTGEAASDRDHGRLHPLG